LSTEKLTCKRTHMRELSVDRQQSSKLVAVGPKQHDSWERRTRHKWQHASQRAPQHACVICSRRFWPTATSFALRFRSTHINTLMYQFTELNF